MLHTTNKQNLAQHNYLSKSTIQYSTSKYKSTTEQQSQNQNKTTMKLMSLITYLGFSLFLIIPLITGLPLELPPTRTTTLTPMGTSIPSNSASMLASGTNYNSHIHMGINSRSGPVERQNTKAGSGSHTMGKRDLSGGAVNGIATGGLILLFALFLILLRWTQG